MRQWSSVLLLACGLCSCGASELPTEQPVVSQSPSNTSTAVAAKGPASSDPSTALPTAAPKPVMPTKCEKASGDLCVPPAKFVKQLCRDGWPTIALVMFAKGTPWTRGWLRGKVMAWNASGGGSDNTALEFEEEVVVLRHRTAASADGMLVSGATGGYDVLRFIGDCVTLAGGELGFRPARRPKNPRIIWEDIEHDMRTALRQDEQVNRAYVNRKKTCRGKYWGTVSDKCEQADKVLVKQIVRVVRQGGKLATPNRFPKGY